MNWYLYSLTDNGNSYTQNWQFGTGNGIASSPAIGPNGSLYFGTWDNHFYALAVPPTITGFTPVSGGPGTTVTIIGSNFTGATAVAFGGTAATSFTVVNDTTITATIGYGTTGTIAVTAPNGTGTSNGVFSYISAITLAQVTTEVPSPTAPPLSVQVPISLAAQGIENTLGGSIAFDPTVLSNPQVALGADDVGGMVLTNMTDAAQGKFSFAIGLPTPQTFAAGTRQVAVLTFTLVSNSFSGTTPVNFANQPMACALVDVNANDLTATWVNGSIKVYQPPAAVSHGYTTNAGVTFTSTAAAGLLAGATSTTGATLTVSIATQPTHGTLSYVNAATGVFSYSPANNTYSGTDTFSYTVTDGTGTSAPATVTMTLDALPTGTAHSYTTDAGVPFTTTAATGLLAGATGTTGDTLTVSIATPPTHGTLSNVNAATGVFTYTPANNTYAGTDTFTYTVFDGIGTSAPATVTITLDALPTGTAHSYTTDAGVPFSTTAATGLLAGATGTTGDTLTVSIATPPTHGTLSNVNAATGVFTYTPANNTYAGTDTFTYTVFDGIGTSAPATVTITIYADPVAVNQSYTINENTTLTTTAATGVLAGDTAASGLPLTAVQVSNPSYGTLTFNANGSFILRAVVVFRHQGHLHLPGVRRRGVVHYRHRHHHRQSGGL